MKKLLFIAFACGVTMSAVAQKTTFGVKGGLNLSMVSTNIDEISDDKQMLPTFHVGGVADIAISNSFSIQPQLLLQGKGVAVKHGDHSDKIRFTSIDIPVNFLYRASGFFIGGGPNLGINVDGKIKADGETEKIDFGSEPGEIKRANVGVNIMTGYQLKSGLFFGANFLADLTNWRNGANEKWRNNLVGISAGYMFGNKKS